MTAKTFDCVQMKRRGAEHIQQKLAGMTPQQQLAYWQEKTTELRQRQASLRNENHDKSNVHPQQR